MAVVLLVELFECVFVKVEWVAVNRRAGLVNIATSVRLVPKKSRYRRAIAECQCTPRDTSGGAKRV